MITLTFRQNEGKNLKKMRDWVFIIVLCVVVNVTGLCSMSGDMEFN
jgi:hypothetical protein